MIKQGQNADDQGKCSQDKHNPPLADIDRLLVEGILYLQESAEEQGQAPDEGKHIVQVVRVKGQQCSCNQQGKSDGKHGFRDPPDRCGTEIADDGPFKFALNIECDNIIFSGMLAFTRDMKYAAFYYGGILKYVSAIELPDAEQLEFLYNTD